MADNAAVSKEGLVIPLIDFSKFLHGSPEERKATAAAILAGFQDAGFIYLKDHPIAAATLRDTFSRSAGFFDQPLDAKLALGWTTPEANRGYSSLGSEKLSELEDAANVDKIRSVAPDLKESFEIGRDSNPKYLNPWPTEEGVLAGFRGGILEFFDQCKMLHMDIMRAIAVGMGLADDFFDEYVDAGDNTLRLLHYPEVKANVFKSNPGQVRAGAHSDYGSITLLFQDSKGGLQVKSPTGQFVDATPVEDTVIVNAGDLLAIWSNDTIKSTVHRVVEPPQGDGETYPSRYSIAYFCHPNTTSLIETLPGTYASEQEKKYSGLISGEYHIQRLAATYSKA